MALNVIPVNQSVAPYPSEGGDGKVAYDEYQITLTSGNFNVADIAGFLSTSEFVHIALQGTITGNCTITLPDITTGEKIFTFKDRSGNGVSTPDYKIEIVPDASDTIDVQSSDATPNVFELMDDFESVTLKADAINDKWEVV